MIPNLKTVGLVLVAVFVVSTVAASAAQATEGGISWAEGTTKLLVEADPNAPNQTFSITPGTIKASFTCDELSAEATVTGTGASSVTAQGLTYSDSGTTPEKEVCTGTVNGIALKVTTKLNGCHYKFSAGTTEGVLAEGKGEGTLALECPAGKVIEVSAPGCLVKQGPQTMGPIYGKTVKTGSGLEHITAEAKIGQTATAHNDAIDYITSGFTCGAHTETDGTFEGRQTTKGFNGAGNPTNVTIT
jgi:hypothetical protein